MIYWIILLPISVEITDFFRKLILITVRENTRTNGEIKRFIAGKVSLI